MPNAVGPHGASKLRNSPLSAARLAVEELRVWESTLQKVGARPAFYHLLHGFGNAATLFDHTS